MLATSNAPGRVKIIWSADDDDDEHKSPKYLGYSRWLSSLGVFSILNDLTMANSA